MKINLKQKIIKSSPTIASILAAVGVGMTVYTTVKATKKAVRLIDKAEEEKGEELTPKEKVKVTYKQVIPVVISGGSTIFCIFASNYLNKKQQLALIGSYEVLRNYYKSYREKVIELYGEEADIEVKKEIAKQYYDNNPDVFNESKRFIFFDDYTGRSIVLSKHEIYQIEDRINNLLWERNYISYADALKIMGMQLTPYEELWLSDYGWTLQTLDFRIDLSYPIVENYQDYYDTYIIKISTPMVKDFKEIKDNYLLKKAMHERR